MRAKIAILLLCAGLAAVGLAGCGTMRSIIHGNPSTFIVFFPVGSAQLTPDGRSIVNDAATVIKRSHPGMVVIAAGTAAGNIEMSQPRFAAVRQALIDDGIDQDLIARAAIADPKLDTLPAKQRVEIRLAPKL
jgi:flagellar motor protein MotB